MRVQYCTMDKIWVRVRRLRQGLDIVKFLSVITKYAVSSLSATAIDLVAFYILMLLCRSSALAWNDSLIILVATIVARVISAIFNCIVNKKQFLKLIVDLILFFVGYDIKKMGV